MHLVRVKDFIAQLGWPKEQDRFPVNDGPLAICDRAEFLGFDHRSATGRLGWHAV